LSIDKIKDDVLSLVTKVLMRGKERKLLKKEIKKKFERKNKM
jgi:hypothetical protein